jgi:hypothetical protein
MLVAAHVNAKSTFQSAAPKELDSPEAPWLYSEFVSPRIYGTVIPAAARDFCSALWAAMLETVFVWFRSVFASVMPGWVAPPM